MAPTSRHHPPAASHRLPQGRDPYPQMSDYRDGNLFLRDSKTGPRTAGSRGRPGLSSTASNERAAGYSPHRRATDPAARAGWTSSGAGSARRRCLRMCTFTTCATPSPAWLSAGRDRAGDRPPARPQQAGDHAEIHSSCRRHGARCCRDGRRRAGGLSMAGRERMKLTDAAIARLRSREREYTVWDSRMVGLGVRVRPSGGRSWVLLQEVAGRSKRVSLGSVDLKRVEEARRECHARRAREELEDRIGRLLRHPCSGTSLRARGKRLISKATSPRRRGASGINWRRSSCRPSARSRSTASGRRASGAGSTAIARPRRAMPIWPSPGCGRSPEFRYRLRSH